MKTLRSPLAAPRLLCLLWCLLAACGRAGELPKEILKTQQKIEQLDKLEPTPANKPLKEVYQQILALQQEHLGYVEKTAGLNQQLKEHAERGGELKRALAEAGAAQPEPAFAGKALAELEGAQELAATEKITLQNQLDETVSRLAQLQARLVPAQNDLALAKASLEQAGKEAQAASGAPLDSGLANALQMKRRAANEARIAQIQSLDLELLSIPNQMELAGVKKSLLGQKLKNLGAYQEKLQARLQALRQAESASILGESLQLRDATNQDPALKGLADENVALGNALTAFADSSQAIADKASALGQQSKLIEQRHAMLKQQLALGGESAGIGELMRQTLMQLESLGEENVPKTVADIQKAQIQSLIYERQINEIADKGAFVRAVVERFPDSQLTMASSEMRERLASLLELRGNLLAKLLDRNQQSLKNWSLLLNAQNQFNGQLRQFDKLLKENLLWTATSPAMSPAWLVDFAAGFRRAGWRELWASLSELLAGEGFTLAALALAYAGLRYALRFSVLPRFQAWQLAANALVGNTRRDAFSNTLLMLAGELLFALPAPLLLSALRVSLDGGAADEAWTRLLGESLRVAALASLLLGLLRQMSKPGGFLQGQLHWPEALVKALQRQLRLRWLLVLLVAYMLVTETQNNSFFRYDFVRFPFLAFCLTLALVFRRLARAWRVAGQAAPPKEAGAPPYWLGGLLVACEIGLAGMEVFGLHLGAFVLQGRVLETLGWALLVVLVHQMLQRWLLLEQRRMAYVRAMAVREERRAAGKVKAKVDARRRQVRRPGQPGHRTQRRQGRRAGDQRHKPEPELFPAGKIKHGS